jgi:hypothetical protein
MGDAAGDARRRSARPTGATVGRLRAVNVAGLLYGGIVCAATIAVASGHADRGGTVVGVVAAVLLTYWLAHVYVRALADRVGAGSAGLTHHLRRAFAHESTVLLGGVPALVVFSVEVLVGIEVAAAGSVALWFSVVLLACIGYLAAYDAGLRGRSLAAETALAGLFGVVAVLLKSLLH